MDEAARLTGRIAVGIDDLRAFRWMAVPTPTEVTFELTQLDPDRVRVRAVGFAEAIVVLADAYPAPTAPPLPPLQDLRSFPIDAEGLYRNRWMFHGPAYQGIRTIDAVGDDGIVGVIETGAAPGALLDNAGQLLGLWVMLAVDRDRLAMPVGIRRMRFHGPHPEPGARLYCDVRLGVFDDRRVVADLVLGPLDGTPWCTIEAWEDRRFDTDARLWNVLMWPERALLSEPVAPPDRSGVVPHGPLLFRDTYGAAPTREQLFRRYLGERERVTYDAQTPRGQRSWLAGRIAAKDAVRRLLWQRGAGKMWPIEIGIETESSGRPVVRTGHAADDLRVSIAHKDDVAVAFAAIGVDVGVDVERVAERGEAFAATAFTAEERALILAGEDEAEWLTRLWTAKEAVGKCLGTGLSGNPRKLPVTDRTGERFLCHGHQVETRRDGDHVIGWTYGP